MNNILSWEDCFMELAETIAKRSKDPSTQVGACIVENETNRIISLGYNGFPYGCSDDEFPWDKETEDNKYLYVVHAELNAILSAKRDLSNAVMYVTHYPCNECMKAIIQSGIKTVIYKNLYKENSIMNIATNKMAKASGVSIINCDSKNCDLKIYKYLIYFTYTYIEHFTKVGEIKERLKYSKYDDCVELNLNFKISDDTIYKVNDLVYNYCIDNDIADDLDEVEITSFCLLGEYDLGEHE